MSRYNDNIFTIYDLMEKKGMFRGNPANVDSIDPNTRQPAYKGPVQFPKMLYHPKGETKVTVPAEIINTPLGPKAVGEQRELIHKIVESAEEEAVLKQLGWLNHPAKSIHAGGGAAPAITSEERIESLEDTIERLRAELADAKASKLAEPLGDAAEREADNALRGMPATSPRTVAA